jgi:hypothetical protein
MTKKRLLKLILAIFLIFGIIISILYIVLLNQLTESKAKELVVNAYNTSSIISAAKGFDGYVRDLKYQVVISDNNLLSPKISLVRASFYPTESTKDLYDIFTLSFKRTGFNSWEVKEYKYSTSTNLSFDKILNYAKSQDIYANNPDPTNIRNISPLTPQEIESNRKLREGGNTYETTFGASAYYLEQVKKNSKVFETTTSKEEKITILQDFLKLQQDTLDVLKSGKEYVYPDGSKIPSNSQTIELTQSSVTQTKSILENTKNQATQ